MQGEETIEQTSLRNQHFSSNLGHPYIHKGGKRILSSIWENLFKEARWCVILDLYSYWQLGGITDQPWNVYVVTPQRFLSPSEIVLWPRSQEHFRREKKARGRWDYWEVPRKNIKKSEVLFLWLRSGCLEGGKRPLPLCSPHWQFEL